MIERNFLVDNNTVREKIDYFEMDKPTHDETKRQTGIKKGKEAVYDFLSDDVLYYKEYWEPLKETNITQESIDKFREYVMTIENMIEERIELYIKNNMRCKYARYIAYEDIYNDIENIKEVEEFEIEEVEEGKIEEPIQQEIVAEDIPDIPDIPNFNPNENELPEEVQINEKGEIIRGEIKDQLSNSGKEEITAIATRQKDSKFRAFVQKVKNAFSKKQNKEHDDISK